MIVDLENFYIKNNDDNIFKKKYVKWAIILQIILCILIVTFKMDIGTYIISILVVILSIIPAMYWELLKYLKIKVISKESIHVLRNIMNYSIRSYNKVICIKNFLIDNNIYSKDNILFLLNYYNEKKLKKNQRDWFLNIILVFIGIFSVSVNEIGNFSKTQFITIFLYSILVIMGITISSLFITTVKTFFLMSIGKEEIYTELEKILTEIYLTYNVEIIE